MELFVLLEKLLEMIEQQLDKAINIDKLAETFFISQTHLRRIFKFAFGTTVSTYIRSRKLSASANELINNEEKIIDIAVKYGFEYEQSYIRAFKREFGIAPGEFRKYKLIIKVTPPIQLFNSNRMVDGVFFGPEFVIVPEFNIVGKKHEILYSEADTKAPLVARRFWDNEKTAISKISNNNIYIGYTEILNQCDFSLYYPSVQVDDLNDIPRGFYGNTFNTSLCVRFRYIGEHHYYDINAIAAHQMYDAIWKFLSDDQQKYTLMDGVYFEKIDTKNYNGQYCMMEWFAPVHEKTDTLTNND